MTLDAGVEELRRVGRGEGLKVRKYDMVFASKPPAALNFTSITVSQQDLVLIVPKKHPLAS